MPDWSKEIRAAVAALNLEPLREAEVVEELSQHLADGTTKCWQAAWAVRRLASFCCGS